MKKSNQKHLIYTSFGEKIGRCTYYKEEYRNSKASIFNDLNFIQNEMGKLLSSVADDKQFIKEITKLFIKEYLENQQFKEKSFKSFFLENNKVYSKKEGISFSEAHLFLVQLKKKFPLFVKRNMELIDLDNLINFNSIKNNKIEQFGEIIAKFKTPGIILNELEKANILDELLSEIISKTGEKISKKDIIAFCQDSSKKSKPSNSSKRFQSDALFKQLYDGELIAKYQMNFLNDTDNKKIKIIKTIDLDFNDINIEAKLKKIFPPIMDRDMERNSVVYRAINQSRLVIRAVFRKYNFLIDTVVLEVSSEIFSTKDDRKKMKKTISKNEERNEETVKYLSKKGIKPTRDNIFKYNLFIAQKLKATDTFAVDPYSQKLNEKILEENLYDGVSYQVDHIIPNSKSNDQSFLNKVLTSSKHNQAKGNQIPLDYFKTYFKWNEKELEAWKKLIWVKFNKKWPKKKLDYLFAGQFDRRVEGFEDKDLNDTRYITKYIGSYLKMEFAKINQLIQNDVKLLTVKGQITSKFRRLWLSDSPWGSSKPRDITHFHHSVDAIVLSQFKTYSQITYYQNLIVLMNTYSAIFSGIKKGEIKSTDEALKYLRTSYNELINNIEKSSKYIWTKNWKEQMEAVLQTMVYSLEGKEIHEVRRFNDFSLFKVTRNSDYLNPLVKDFSYKLENLIPVQLELEEKEVQSKFNDKEVYKIKEPKFVSINNQQKWSELNNKDISQYPLVSYLEKRRVRGEFLASEQMSKKEKAYDDKGELRKDYRKDSNGNYWEIATYYGLHLETLKPIYRLEMFNAKDNKYKGKIVVPNTTFEYEGDFYTFKGFTSKRIVSPKNGLNYAGGTTNYNKIFGYWPNISISNCKNIKIININLLGKASN
ncbi:MAG: type II CRISPR RNA-guided endonuclease Cas9 [Mycoplasmataceae bacterium]|nr:type II CRISPR RNA-guided endonuclease Cas9 [Mycoplasmataceae bacterium]